MAPHRPRLFSIPPGASFLDALADALIDGTLVGDIGWTNDPLAVAGATIYLPTRRAARAFKAALAARAHRPMILPRVVPLGDANEAELHLIGDGDFATEAASAAPAATPAARLVFLADLVMRWRKQLELAITPSAPDHHGLIAESPAEAFGLANDLAGVLDMLTIEGVKAEQLSEATPGEHDEYWRISREFLKIATDVWPLYLATQGLSDPVERNVAVLRERARQIAEKRAAGPFIAAGSTGTNPATADLIAAIARHPRGAVVLPGLDLISSDASFASVIDDADPHPGHPQTALARLMLRLQATRVDVAPLGRAKPRLAARERILNETMQTPAHTAHWPDARAHALASGDVARALRGVAIIEADSDREEALTIALAMRRAIRAPGRTAALITPDRALAERVGVALARWNLQVDDSAGRPLSRAPRGALAALAAQWLAAPADGALLIALLSHPRLAISGMTHETMRRAAATIDIGLLRGYPAVRDLTALRETFAARRGAAGDWRAPRPAKRLSEADWSAASSALDALIAIAHAFAEMGGRGGTAPLGDWAEAHRAALINLTQDRGEDDEWLFADIDGEALRDLFDELANCGRHRAPLTRNDYPFAIKQLLDSVQLSPPARTHPRLAIWGLLEARLMRADTVILGGLNETVWPPQPSPDAFLNRALRSALHLPQPERRIGQTAHDFVAAFGGADRAILSRAKKSGGAPTIPSRFWQRLFAYAGPGGDGKNTGEFSAWFRARARGERFLAIARALDDAGPAAPAPRPNPKPPAHLVPRQLSVSRVESLVRDPYAIFAQSILELDPLPGVGVTADFALRGTLIHDVVARFADSVDPFAPDATTTLIAMGERLFAASGVDPERISFWRPAFRRAARDYVEWERGRRPNIAKLDLEQSGEIELTLVDQSRFRLTGRADRIERLKDGTLALIDFKTGSPPSRKEVLRGLSPQLTLEAAMATRGGFDAADKGRAASSLIYVRLSGAKSGAFESDLADASKRDPVDASAVPEKHLAQLQRRMNALVSGALGFPSRPIPKYARDVGDYDHLARVAEWSRGGDADE